MEAKKTPSRVILRAASADNLCSRVLECMDFCEWKTWIKPDATVVVKPNLCTAVPDKWEMSNTAPALARAVCEVLLSRTKRIYLAEADGLRQTAWEAFHISHYEELARDLGIELVNLSELVCTKAHVPPAGDIEIPRLLLESHAFITLPVLKTHALTYFTGALKNQWGCLPHYDRILWHKYLDQMLVSLHRLLKPRIALMDGIICMEGRGPANGKPRRLNVLLASQDAVALDSTAMRLVGLEPTRAVHVALAAQQGLGHMSSEEIEVDGDWSKHRTQFEPAVLDKAIAMMNFMSRYRWFVKYALEQDYVFYPVRAFVQVLRRVGLVEGGS